MVNDESRNPLEHRIQIAGIHDEKELGALLAAGVDDFAFPVGPWVRTPDCSDLDASKLAASLPEGKGAVAIVYLRLVEDIVGWWKTHSHFTKLQLHADISLHDLQAVRTRLPGVYIIKSLIIGLRSKSELEREVLTMTPYVNAFITDTYDPVTGATGATGKTHDWMVSKFITDISPKPVILAGGLDDSNVADAIETVRPFAVDAHTGVEGKDGRKDPEKLMRFVTAAREAFKAQKFPRAEDHLSHLS